MLLYRGNCQNSLMIVKGGLRLVEISDNDVLISDNFFNEVLAGKKGELGRRRLRERSSKGCRRRVGLGPIQVVGRVNEDNN